MAIVSDVEIRLRADIARLQQDMTAARRSVDTATSGITRTLQTLKGAFAGLAIGAAFKELAGATITAQREFDKLNSALITATGSSKNAEQAFAALQRFAANTPYDLQQVTEGFLKLRNLGLTPSERALNSYGNTAGALGKNLNQMVEAVADAATGEFERLKEFGIKASQQGDFVTFTFQGVTTKIKNNAADIESYLIKIGETKFAGGMELQAKTLDGAISNLGDSWDATLRAFSKSGFGEAVHASVLGLSDALTDLQAILNATGLAANKEADAVKQAGPIHKAITTVFEGAAIAGEAVALTFRTVGGSIGALAAAVSLAVKGDWASAKEVYALQKQAVVDDAKATAERIRNITKAADEAKVIRDKEAAEKEKNKTDELAQYKVLGDGKKALTATEKKAAEDAKEFYKKTKEASLDTYDQLVAELQGNEELTSAEKKRIEVTNELARDSKNLTKAQQQEIIDWQNALVVLDKLNGARKKDKEIHQQAVEAAQKDVDAARAQTKSLEEQVKYYGLTEEAVLRLQAAELDRQIQWAQADEDDIEVSRLQRVQAELLKQADLQKKLGQMKADTTFWDGLESTAHSTFLSIADGGKDTATRLKETFKNTFFDWLYQMTLKKWIISVGATLSGDSAVSNIAASATASAGSAGSTLPLLSNIKSAYTALTSGLEKTVAEGFQGVLDKLGLSMSSGTPGSLAQAVGKGANTLAGYGIGSVANSLISGQYQTGSGVQTVEKVATLVASYLGGPLGGGIAGAISGLVNRAFGMGAKEVTSMGLTGSLSTSAFTGSTFANWKQDGGWFRSDKSGTDTTAVDAATSASLVTAYKAIIESTSAYATALGQDAAAIENRTEQINIALTSDAEKNAAAITEYFNNLGNSLATSVVPNLADFTKEGETAASTLARLATQYAALDGVFAGLGVTMQQAFGATGAAALAAQQQLITAAGSIDTLASQTSYFSSNFLTEAQQLAPVQAQVTKRLAELGQSGLTTTEQFRDAVLELATSGKLATQAGAETYEGLLALAPAFKTVADAAAEAAKAAQEQADAQADAQAKAAAEAAAAQAQAVAEAAAALAASNQGYQDQIDQLLAAREGEAAVRAFEIRGMEDSTVALYDRLAALKAEDAALAAAAKAAADRAAADEANEQKLRAAWAANAEALEQANAAIVKAQADAAASLAATNKTYQDQIDQILAARQGEAAVRALETAGMDSSTVALYDRLKALKAEEDASTAAAQSAQQAADALAQANKSYQDQIDQLLAARQGAAAVRALETKGMDASTVALYDKLAALKAEDAATAAAQQVALAMAEAQQQAAAAQKQAAADAVKAAEELRDAWADATTSVVDEVKRILGLMDPTGATSVASAQAAFATATAAARAGDQDAYKSLAALSKNLLDVIEENAATAFDLRVAQAQTAASLQATAQIAAQNYGFTVPAYATGTDMITQSGLAYIHKGEQIVPAADNGGYTGGNTDLLQAILDQLVIFDQHNTLQLTEVARQAGLSASHFDDVINGGQTVNVKVIA
jgi:predicted Fe-Mo cluster-binding NifX family protein